MGKIEGTITAVLTLLMIPVFVLNLLSGLVAGIWLIALGEWKFFLVGIASIFFSSWVLGLALLPQMALAAPAVVLIERRRFIPGLALGALSNLYLVAVFTVWCAVVFYYFLSQANETTFWPLLLWSYSTAKGPISYMAAKERDNESTALTSIFVDMGCMSMMLAVAFFRPSVLDIAIVFGLWMAVALLMNWYMLYERLRYAR